MSMPVLLRSERVCGLGGRIAPLLPDDPSKCFSAAASMASSKLGMCVTCHSNACHETARSKGIVVGMYILQLLSMLHFDAV